MLVLTRKKGEAIKIGEDVFIRVLGVSGEQIRLGFEAPKEISIVRTELIDRANKKAVNAEV